MDPSAHTLAPTALIVGCGYLGRHLAAALNAHGVLVYGTTRTQRKAAELSALGVRPLLVSVTQRLTLAALRPALEAPSLDTFFLLPPGRPDQAPPPRNVLLDGMAHILAELRWAHVRKGVMTSSTAVYAQTGGQRVDADTPAVPTDERGHLLLEAEQQWLNAAPAPAPAPAPGDGSTGSFHVARLAGLYGPGRVVGLSSVREGAPLIGDPAAMLNLLHVEDAAAFLLAMATAPAAGRIELGCDDHPVPRIEYYRELARRLGVPAPTVLDDETAAATLGLSLDRLRRTSSKHCDNTPTRRRTGWAPRFPDFRTGLDALGIGSTPQTR